MTLVRNKVLEAFGRDLGIVTPDLVTIGLRAGQVLFEPGEEIRLVYFLHSGVVSKLSIFADGGEVEAAIVGREGAIGATAALGLRHSLTRDVCHVDAVASRMPVEPLRLACARSPTIQQAIESYALWKLSCAVRSGACNARHSVSQRLCRWLLVCSDVLESPEIALPQEVFSKMLGVQRSSVNPILQALKAEGALVTARSRLIVRDRQVLLDRACECYAAMQADQQWLVQTQIARAG